MQQRDKHEIYNAMSTPELHQLEDEIKGIPSPIVDVSLRIIHRILFERNLYDATP